jgi:hypothetical protein
MYSQLWVSRQKNQICLESELVIDSSLEQVKTRPRLQFRASSRQERARPLTSQPF